MVPSTLLYRENVTLQRFRIQMIFKVAANFASTFISRPQEGVQSDTRYSDPLAISNGSEDC